MKAKYVIFDIDGLEQPIVFPELITHRDLAMRIRGEPVSAGFVVLTTTTVEGTIEPKAEAGYYCYGRSESLNLDSRPEDSDILNKLISGRSRY